MNMGSTSKDFLDAGWEVLSGEGLAKAMQVTGAEVTLAKKYGRKTVFARFHGTVTLYVVRDNGAVVQNWFMGLPADAVVRRLVEVATSP